MTSLWECVAGSSAGVSGAFHGANGSIALAELSTASCLAGRLEALRGRSVLLALREQLSAAVALLELDGVARRMVLCTPDLTPQRLAEVAATAETDAVLSDTGPAGPWPSATVYELKPRPVPAPIERRGGAASEWILLTSGTTGSPKLVVHTLSSLAGTLPRREPGDASVWSTFYDIRRYGGLQIYLRAVLCGSPLVLSSPEESTAEFLARAAARGRDPHFRHALALAPCADERRGAAARSPPTCACRARSPIKCCSISCTRPIRPRGIAHAFASTEAGVAFDVDDGRAGFPAEFFGRRAGRHRNESRGWHAAHPLAAHRRALSWAPRRRRSSSADGYVDTGDLVELQDGRYYFRGRRGGIINVGGLKVYPEEVESRAQRRSAGAHVAGALAPQSHHRRGGRRGRGARGFAQLGARGSDGREHQERPAPRVPPRLAGAQGARDAALRRGARTHRRRQTGAPQSCLTSSSRAAAAGSALRWRAAWRRPAIASSPSPAARAQSSRRRAAPRSKAAAARSSFAPAICRTSSSSRRSCARCAATSAPFTDS